MVILAANQCGFLKILLCYILVSLFRLFIGMGTNSHALVPYVIQALIFKIAQVQA